jgi:hypothetical protein
MTLENHGVHDPNNLDIWQIDHIVALKYKPTADFVMTEEELRRRLHYTNLQPLRARDNISKGNR